MRTEELPAARAADPRATDLPAADPRAADPRAADLRAADLRAADLFSGMGGSALGFTQAGFRVLAGFEIDWQARTAMRTLFRTTDAPPQLVSCDLAHTNDFLCARAAIARRISLHNLDLLSASPPCVDFSRAGKCIEEKNAALSINCMRIIANLMPRSFVIENVPPFLWSDTFETCRAIALEAGYDSVVFHLNASRFGVGQARKRVFWVGVRGAGENALRQFHARIKARESTTPTSVAEALFPGVSPRPFETYYLPPRNIFKRGVYSVDHPAPTFTRTCLSRKPNEYHPRETDAGPLRTAATLTPHQVLRLQGFPEGTPLPRFAPSVLGHLIGNAVPPPLTRVIGESLRELLLGLEPQQPPHPPVFITADLPRYSIGLRAKTNRTSRIDKFANCDNADQVEFQCAAAGATLYNIDDHRRFFQYEVGTTELGDRMLRSIVGDLVLPAGMILEIRDRARRSFSYDDMYFFPPGGDNKSRIRSLSGLRAYLNKI